MAVPEHGSGHETSCFWGWRLPKSSQHADTYRPLLGRISRLGNGSRGTFVAKGNLVQLTDDAVICVSLEVEGHSLSKEPLNTATVAGAKSFLKLNDGLAAANLLTRHARCCSDKKSSTGLHDIASSLRVWQWFS